YSEMLCIRFYLKIKLLIVCSATSWPADHAGPCRPGATRFLTSEPLGLDGLFARLRLEMSLVHHFAQHPHQLSDIADHQLASLLFDQPGAGQIVQLPRDGFP